MALRGRKKEEQWEFSSMKHVEVGGGRAHIPPGDYTVEVVEVEKTTSKAGNEMLAWIFLGKSKQAKGKKFYYHVVLDQDWKIKETFEGLGVDTSEDFVVTPSELVGLEGTATIDDEEYNGKINSKIVRLLMPNGQDEEEDEEDESPPNKASANGKKKAVAKQSVAAVNEMSEDELESLISKNDLDLDLSKHKTLRKKKTEVIAALEENGLLA